MNIKNILDYARKRECSDVHITVGIQVAFRRYGRLEFMEEIPSIEESEQMIFYFLTEEEKLLVKSGTDIDVGVMLEDHTRVRLNIYHQRNHLAASIRLLYTRIPTFKELQLPSVVEEMCNYTRGLVLITGPTGSGKTTTLASMLDFINHNMDKHIITIEDPIEYIFNHDHALIHQRQIGKDVDDFATALRSGLRQDPDIILVGEMRDYETIKAAVTAAETGHLVLSTLHTTSAAQTIDRIIDACPVNGQNQLRAQLAGILNGVITQQLVPLADGHGRVLATEVLVVNYAISNLIREKKSYMISTAIQSNVPMGMHTMNSDLATLIGIGKITRAEAMKYSPSPKELERMLKYEKRA